MIHSLHLTNTSMIIHVLTHTHTNTRAMSQNLISQCTTCSWINIFVDPGTTFHSANQIWDDKFTVYVRFRLTIRVWCFYIGVIHLSIPTTFRDHL